MKNELLELKKLIEMVSKQYGIYDVCGMGLVGKEDKFSTVKSIVDKIDMSKSIGIVKILIDDYAESLRKKGCKFEKIEAFIPLDLYVSKDYILNERKTNIHRITKNDVLLDIVPASLMLYAYEKSNSQDYIEDDSLTEKFIGNIKYSDFVKELEKCGYEVSPKNFDELFEQDLLKGKSGFSISKTVSKNKTLKK